LALSKSQFGPFLIDTEERMLRRDGQPLALTPKAFDLLAALLDQPGRLTSKEELLQKVWPGTFVEESNLAYHVFALRKVLGDTAEDERYIETVPKRGYRFAAVVTPVPIEIDGPPSERAPEKLVAPRWFRRGRVWAGSALVLAVAYLSLSALRPPRTTENLRALPLTSLSGVVRTPSLSPDGTHVVFTWSGESQDNPDLYVQLIGAGSPMRLTTDPRNDYAPNWSPDGRTIAFLRRQPDEQQIEVRLIAPLGGQERTVATIEPRLGAFRPLSVSWCPDSTCVLVTDGLKGGASDAVFAISLATGQKHQLTHPEGRALDADPVISPDGRTLVFRRDTTPFTGAFYRVSLKEGTTEADGDAVPITSRLGAGKPVWMPDSREILFADRGGLWRLNVTGGGVPERLPFVGQDGQAPIVSRSSDGKLQLVYVRSFSDVNLWRVDSAGDGTPAPGPPVAAVASTRAESTPNLAPSGATVAFTSDRSGDLEIWSAAPDGANAVQLTSTGGLPGYPRWSPDGARVAFHGDVDGVPGVLVVAAGGGPATKLMAEPGDSGFPSFSRDGRWVYFCSLRSGQARIWKVAVGGGAAVQVTQTTGVLGIETVDSRDLYYVEAPERAGSLWRQPLAGGVAVKVLEGVMFGSFDVVERGLYYIDRVAGDAGTPGAAQPATNTRLRFFEFSTQRSTTVASGLGNVGSGLSATRDGRTVFFSRIDSSVNELMIVHNFR
jgi:Tol biopolymer transport system component/DNA-binding winged helix-turn-helix (wHTH) protein